MKRSPRQLNPSLKNQIVKTFAQAIADLNNLDECNSFMKHFFTESELEMLAKRLAIAYWLKKKRSYRNIRDNLKVSSATIACVSSIMYLKGFDVALQKIEADQWATKWAEKIHRLVKK